jgi:hypothetical protein
MRAFVGTLVAVSFVSATSAAPSARTVGEIQSVYDWKTENCAQKHMPDKSRCAFSFKCKNMTEQNMGLCRDCDPDVVDAPTKAFRRKDATGTAEETVLTGSVNWGSRADIGETLDSVKHNCDVYYNASWRQEPELYASREWIQSPWMFENQSAVALTHMEHHCDMAGSEGSLSCAALNLSSGGGDFSAVTLLASSDGGRNWQHARQPPLHVVAASPQNFSVGGNRLGFRSPSNIVAGQHELSGWYYASVTSGWGLPGNEGSCSNFVDPKGLQHFCTCVMRTRDLTDPHSWKAWGGQDFTVQLFATPYDSPAPDPSKHVCQPTINMTYPSILWSSFYKKYLLLGTTNGRDSDGWSFQLSDDLVRWSAPVALETSSLTATGGPGGNTTTTSTTDGYSLYAVRPFIPLLLSITHTQFIIYCPCTRSPTHAHVTCLQLCCNILVPLSARPGISKAELRHHRLERVYLPHGTKDTITAAHQTSWVLRHAGCPPSESGLFWRGAYRRHWHMRGPTARPLGPSMCEITRNTKCASQSKTAPQRR